MVCCPPFFNLIQLVMINNKIDNKINVRDKIYSLKGTKEILFKMYLECFLPDHTIVASGYFKQTNNIRVFIYLMNKFNKLNQ